jgi:hypothetical protein
MKTTKLTLMALMALMMGFTSCSSDDETPVVEEPAHPLVGSWKLTAAPGSLGVGPAAGDYSWWSNDAQVVTDRACLFDDLYVFEADGTFKNVQGGSTWLEGWQGVEADGCGTPVAPHNGATPGTWAVTNQTLTISGAGSYMGLAKVHNSGEDGAPTNNTINYSMSLTNNDTTLELTISGFQGGGETWFFRFTKQS